MTKDEKRCPNGTRRNPKTKKCEKKDLIVVKKRCPNGTRRNRITKKCEKKDVHVPKTPKPAPKKTTIATTKPAAKKTTIATTKPAPKKTTIAKTTTVSKTKTKSSQPKNEKYTITKRLGAGSNGQVFLAKNEKDEQVAIKVGKSNVIKNQFSKLNILKKKNICKYFICPINYYEKDYKGHVVMDYLKNYMDLSEVMKHHYCISLADRRKIQYDLQKALHLLHRNNLIHSDIKPANIMVKVDHDKKKVLPEARIIDIGGLLEKSSMMTLFTITRKYFDTSIVFPHVNPMHITNNAIFSKIYSFDMLKKLDNSALQKTFVEMNQLSSC